MRIQFDSLRNPKPLTIVLATRDGTKLGTLPAKSVRVAGTFNSYFELSFEVSKKNKNRKLAQWDNIKDFKLVWLKEHDLWLEIAVQLKENSSTVKSVSAKSLAEAELSQTNLYQVEINTENDIAREDYDPTVFYDKSNPNASLLHRVLSKTPHYSIGYVESSLHNIQRTFTFDGKPIYDALQEVAKEIGCYIDFSVHSDEFGKPKRVINVYDLKNYCKNCGTRGEFDVCPNCGKTEIELWIAQGKRENHHGMIAYVPKLIGGTPEQMIAKFTVEEGFLFKAINGLANGVYAYRVRQFSKTDEMLFESDYQFFEIRPQGAGRPMGRINRI